MHADTVIEATLGTQVLLDPNVRPEGLLVAEEKGQFAGFVLVVYFHPSFSRKGLAPEPGWVWDFGVARS